MSKRLGGIIGCKDKTSLFSYHCLRPFFVSLEVSLFPSTFVPLPFSLCMEITPYVFPFGMVFFYLVIMGWILDIKLYARNQIIQFNSKITHIQTPPPH